MSGNPEDIKRLEKKMEDMLDNTLGRKNGLVKVAHPTSAMSNNSYKQYKSSFLTLGDMQIPEDYREIFKWCRYFYKFDSLVGGAIRSLATFPVTDYVLNDSKAAEEDESIDENETSEEYKFYSGMLKDLDLYKHAIEVGIDYNLYGNCIILAEPGTKKVKRRDETGEIVEKKQVVWKSIRRLDPGRVRIDRDPKTQEKIFYYEVPADLKAIIQKKAPKEKYDRIPKIFKDAVEKNGIVRLNSKYVHHFAMPTESGDSGLWATPPILHAMKLILYTNILRQAQEAIAHEHIIPKRIYYFNETTSTDPSFNFGQVADDFAFELNKQLRDPNYQVISPIPINQIQHGGNGKNLMLVPEIEQLQNTILAALQVPREFIFGGVSYSGSTTSLRILENNFITYRVLLEDYVNNFLIKGLAEIRGEWEVEDDDDKLVSVSFAELKMQDDIQQKELMIRLNQQGKLPDDVLYEKVLGLDGMKIVEQLQTEQKRKMEEQFDLQMFQMDLQQKMAAKGGNPAAIAPQQQAAGGEGAEPQATDPTAGTPIEEPAEGAPAAGGEIDPATVNQKAQQIALELTKMNDAQVDTVISQLPDQLKVKVQSFYQQFLDQKDMETDMRPMPEKQPPRREGGV